MSGTYSAQNDGGSDENNKTYDYGRGDLGHEHGISNRWQATDE